MQSIIICCTLDQLSFDANTYSYGDRILKNIQDNVHEVFYSGQNKGRKDDKLLQALKNNSIVKIFYRFKKSSCFTFLGETNNYDIIQYRKVNIGEKSEFDDRLQLHFILEHIYDTDVPITIEGGLYRYKKDVLHYLGYNGTVNYGEGFYILNL